MSASDFRFPSIDDTQRAGGLRPLKSTRVLRARTHGTLGIFEMRYNLIPMTVINEKLFPDESSRSLQRGRFRDRSSLFLSLSLSLSLSKHSSLQIGDRACSLELALITRRVEHCVRNWTRSSRRSADENTGNRSEPRRPAREWPTRVSRRATRCSSAASPPRSPAVHRGSLDGHAPPPSSPRAGNP